MKYVYNFLMILIMFTASLNAQVTNSNFETWDGNNPEAWQTSNYIDNILPVTKSSQSYTGSFAAKGEVVTNSSGDLFIPVLTSVPQSPAQFQKYSSMNLHYQFNSVGGDFLTITVLVYNDITLLGGGAVQLSNSTSGYTHLNVPIEYFFEGEPNYCFVVIGAGNEDEEIGGHIGTWFLIDDITFGGTTGVDDNNNELPEGFSLEQNYPNPFNPSTTIEFSIPFSAEVSLKIYNLLGQEIATLINEKEMSDGDHRISWDAESVSNGTYIYRITAGSFSLSKKMVLLK